MTCSISYESVHSEKLKNMNFIKIRSLCSKLGHFSLSVVEMTIFDKKSQEVLMVCMIRKRMSAVIE